VTERDSEGAAFLGKVYDYRKHGFDADAWIHELTESVLGDSYRFLPGCWSLRRSSRTTW
jgi:hypothetical protein